MRALRVDGLTELPAPAGDGEALVRVVLSGICTTDLELAKGYLGFRGTLGHEFVGVVEEGDLAGTRVVGEINAGCGSCGRCAAGDSRHCATRTVLGIVDRDGAHADYLRLPACNLIPVPATVSDVAAVFVEPLAAALAVLERCPIAPGQRVCVIGDGKLGLLIAMVLRDHAPVLVGKHPHKLALAGVESTLLDDAVTLGRVFDVVIEASGSATGFELALALLVPQGRLVLKSTFHGTTPIDAARIVVEEVTVIGSRCGRFAPALALLETGGIAIGPLVSETLSLGDGERAMQLAAEPGMLKVLLAR